MRRALSRPIWGAIRKAAEDEPPDRGQSNKVATVAAPSTAPETRAMSRPTVSLFTVSLRSCSSLHQLGGAVLGSAHAELGAPGRSYGFNCPRSSSARFRLLARSIAKYAPVPSASAVSPAPTTMTTVRVPPEGDSADARWAEGFERSSVVNRGWPEPGGSRGTSLSWTCVTMPSATLTWFSTVTYPAFDTDTRCGPGASRGSTGSQHAQENSSFRLGSI